MKHTLEYLTAQVQAVNAANKYHGELYAILTKALAPFVGQKVIKADRELTAKVKQALPGLPNTPNLRVSRYLSDYSLVWTIYSSAPFPHGSASYDVGVYAAEIRDGVLVKITEPATGLRTDYTVEEVQKARQAAREAREAYEKAKSACFPFGE